jgi:hypothetical protein
MGEKDIFFQAHVIMGDAMKREGLTMTNLISPGTGHVIDPVTHAEQMRRIAEHVAAAPRQLRELRFVTWTLKYSRCHWLQVTGLERHYARAELSARLGDDQIEVQESKNITQFVIRTSDLPAVPKTIRVGATELAWPKPITSDLFDVVISRQGDSWRIEGDLSQVPRVGKRPGLQGPIDDAFTTPFLCVHGTGQPWNVNVKSYADASLKRFAEEWHHYFRGELPVKDDTEVTAEDIRTRNLILFGDPGSNSWIANMLPHLPLMWSRETLILAGQEYSAANHVPALIARNPHPNARGSRYVVFNSGHTFRGTELAKVNYLLFPRWGDWAVLQVDPSRPGSEPAEEKVIRAGYFDEQWRFMPSRKP